MSSGHFDVSQNVANKRVHHFLCFLWSNISILKYILGDVASTVAAGLCTLEECGHLLHKRRSLPGQGYKRQTFDILSNNKYELMTTQQKVLGAKLLVTLNLIYGGEAMCTAVSSCNCLFVHFWASH